MSPDHEGKGVGRGGGGGEATADVLRGGRGGRGAHGGWGRRRLARVRECAKAVRSGIIYGATCKVRKITPASAGFAETTLVYATDPSGRTPCGSAGRRADDVYEFFSRITYFPRFPQRIISTARKNYLLYCPQSEILRMNKDVHS